MDRVLVTGASGFVAKHVIGELLRAGYAVRGTVRGQGKVPGIWAAVAALAPGEEANLELVAADLLDDHGWADAMQGISAVMHVAAAIVAVEPKDPAEVVRPAVEGTERVLAFAAAAGIKRVVMTSSIATVGYGLGHERGVRRYTEADFTNLDGMRQSWAYCIGKTRAERAAWTFAEQHGLELTTIHPGAILGPATDADTSISLGLVTGLLDGTTPAMARIGFAISDVRDVAAMHLAALEKPESVGQRYLCTGPFMRFEQVADVLRRAYPDYPVTSKIVPDWIIRLLAAFGGSVRQVINDVGNEKHFDGSKGEALLGRPYRSVEDAILSAAESGIRFGLVKALHA
ncbi:NAD-dependent epimerase/dehydratase family protein [Devosia sp. XJ19-1]|uniref:NAD-dependent epimerase/dehydratase family protein n=1 Tax=Devosia ureilytica TaxID=2952754 RepID=A0A9Q4ALM5_9HYPH|nr:NAD-dependent epimerase/dehydratase family protein [Devosia ureilytica]MCP8882005.1 NAD-dependent epimerase/dehydratase family protein [Devosia ureilytica]MCP8886109.1 NAD-dependent epimerase/dehydratase family protein [Devosia ureilytica]